MNQNPCKCVDCGGDQPAHSNDCTYMLELHGDPVPNSSPAPANPGYCCSQCGQGFDFGCRCPDY